MQYCTINYPIESKSSLKDPVFEEPINHSFLQSLQLLQYKTRVLKSCSLINCVSGEDLFLRLKQIPFETAVVSCRLRNVFARDSFLLKLQTHKLDKL